MHSARSLFLQGNFQISRRTKIVLSKISFSGATLGPDYEITVNVAGQTASVKVDMNRRREALLNREIFYVPEVPEARRLPLRIDILEKDDHICRMLLRSRLDSQAVGTIEVLA